MRGLSGFAGAGLVPVAGVVVVAGLVVVVVPAGAVAVPLVPVALLVAGVAAGVEAGSTVSGVGSGGSGFVRIPATNSFMPSVLSLLRYLYLSLIHI